MIDPQAIREKETKNSFYRAVEGGNARSVLRMLRGGLFKKAVDPNLTFPKLSRRHHFWAASDNEDVTPLGVAVRSGHLDIVRLLVEAGADVNYLSWRSTPLELAAQRGRTDIAMYLLEHGAEPKDRSALAEASRNGLVELVEVLLRKGAEPNASIASNSAIWAAVLGGSSKVVELLLLNGARVNIQQDHPRCTLLELAIGNNRTEIVRLLLEHGARKDDH
jgi:ankyrin repeat protein